MRRLKARFLGHDLWIEQDSEGQWRCWNEGLTTVKHSGNFATMDRAQSFAHALAHDALEGKNGCDCPEELNWVPLT
jgi:hypothetical protein